MIFCDQYEGALKLRQETLIVKQKEFELQKSKRRARNQEIAFLVSSMFFVSLMFFVGVGIGEVLGVNTPNDATCHQGNPLCSWLRFRNPKLVLPVSVPSHKSQVKKRK